MEAIDAAGCYLSLTLPTLIILIYLPVPTGSVAIMSWTGQKGRGDTGAPVNQPAVKKEKPKVSAN